MIIVVGVVICRDVTGIGLYCPIFDLDVAIFLT